MKNKKQKKKLKSTKTNKRPTMQDLLDALKTADLTVPDDVRIFMDSTPVGKEIW